MANNWVKTEQSILKLKKLIPESNWLDLRFMDFFGKDATNLSKVSTFLGMESFVFRKFFQENMSKDKAHLASYMDYFPNWEKELPQEAIKLLEQYNYI